MNTSIVGAEQANTNMAPDEPVAIEQSKDSVLFPADQILTVISELHVCYDYCAVWKETPPDESTVSTEANP